MFLTDVAHRVEPPKPARSGRNAVLVMTAAVTAVGVAGVVLTRRSNVQRLVEEEITEPESEQATADGQVHST
jgi:hypothetical protein